MLKNAITLKTKVTLLDGFETDFTASLFLPDTPVKALFFCQPGGGNTKDYFNLGQAKDLTIHSPRVCVTMALQ